MYIEANDIITYNKFPFLHILQFVSFDSRIMSLDSADDNSTGSRSSFSSSPSISSPFICLITNRILVCKNVSLSQKERNREREKEREKKRGEVDKERRENRRVGEN